MDRISKLPPTIIENILCLVPIQEAARTSILCKEWRYHWTKIPKLEFDEKTFQVSSYGDELSALEEMSDYIRGMAKRRKLLYAINQVLLKHKGSIDEFTLIMDLDKSRFEIDHIISYLSKNKAVKKLKLDLGWHYKLPSSFFMFDHLTDLYLEGCHLGRQSTIKGFYNLTSLYIDIVSTTRSTLLHFLSGCPVLKSLTLIIDYIQDIGDSTITNLFECLPMVEYLCIWHTTMKCFAQNGVPHMLPSPLVHLKYLYFDHIELHYGLPSILLLIRSSPNLETLKLEVFKYPVDCEKRSFTHKDCPDIWLPRLKKFEILFGKHEKLELDFVKLILAMSPVLKKAKILLWEDIGEGDKQQVSGIVLSSQRASPVVDVLVERKN